MNVWVVTEVVWYDGTKTLGVFSTKEKAMVFVEDFLGETLKEYRKTDGTKTNTTWYESNSQQMSYIVKNWEVDK